MVKLKKRKKRKPIKLKKHKPKVFNGVEIPPEITALGKCSVTELADKPEDWGEIKRKFQQEAFNEGPFSVVVADSPWSYSNYRKACQGAASSVMEVMRTEDICAVPVKQWAAKNCLLVMWATFPRILAAFRVAHAWGFLEDDWHKQDFTSKQYKSGFPWVKTVPNTGNISTGIGHWTQGTSELLFLFTKGKLKKKAGNAVKGLLHGDRGAPVFYCPKGGKHSNKPEDLQTWLSRIVDGSRLELFSRRPLAGWQTWGLDTGFQLDADGVHALHPASMECLPADYIPF